MKRGTKQIVERVYSAIAAATINNPNELREAAAHIRERGYYDDETDGDERAVIAAFATLLENSAANKERILQETFAEKVA